MIQVQSYTQLAITDEDVNHIFAFLFINQTTFWPIVENKLRLTGVNKV